MSEIEVLRVSDTGGFLVNYGGDHPVSIPGFIVPALLTALLEDSPAAIKMHIDKDGHCIVDDERYQQGVAGKTGTCWLVSHGGLPIREEGGK